MKTGGNFGSSPGPTPGNKGSVRQHQAMAQGYTVPMSERRVDEKQRETTTGETSAPGLTSRAMARKM